MYIPCEAFSGTLLHRNRKLSSRISLQNRLFCLCRLPAVRDAILSNDDVTLDCIDDIVSDLQKIVVNLTKSTFGYMSNKQNNKDQLILIQILGLLILVKKREMSSTKLVIDIDLINLMEGRKS